ncbi:MAG: hypothetical protein WC947_04885 [Elusimicrobiota bacterium]
MKLKRFALLILFCLVFVSFVNANEKVQWTENFPEDARDFSSKGSNTFFILEPGFQSVLEGKEEGKDVKLIITVLDETKKIGDIETRVVEEKESKNGELVEVSRNFFAISKKTNNVYYFGEDVDIYSKGKIVSHDGAWLSGTNGAKFGLIMPGSILLGARYYQEVAPAVAMDRAEIISMTETMETPAGVFKNCLKTEEGSALNEREIAYKFYTPGIGLIKDGSVKLVKYGYSQKERK